MTDCALTDLDPCLQPLAQQWLDQTNTSIAPSKCRITVTWRDANDQNVAKACGSSKAGSGQSPHNYTLPDGTPASRAFDFAVFDPDGNYIKDGTNPAYSTAGQIAENLGLEWGGRWTIDQDGCGPDFDHIQMINWRTI
jgi:hypothetical protein